MTHQNMTIGARDPTIRDSDTLKIDVDRLGVVALDAVTSKLLASLSLRGAAAEEAKPHTIHFKCSHLISSAASVTPTFPARNPSDRRLRRADRVRAGEMLVRAFIKHIGANHALTSLSITNAPFTVADWQGLAAALRANGCKLHSLNLSGSRVGDAGLAVLAPSLLGARLTQRCRCRRDYTPSCVPSHSLVFTPRLHSPPPLSLRSAPQPSRR